jgi:predicted ester cyclase
MKETKVPEQENVARLRRVIEEGFGRGRLEVLDELMAADCIEHQRGLPPGRDGARQTVETLHRWMSDFDIRVLEISASGDLVWSLNRARGTNTGSVMGNPPTGKTCEIDVIDVVRFRDGRIVEHWGIADQLGMLIQLGLVPARQPAQVA